MRAIAVVPENAAIFLKELNMVVDFDTIDKDYLVDGFEGPISYIFYTRQEFHKEWRFVFDQEHEGQFSTVILR